MKKCDTPSVLLFFAETSLFTGPDGRFMEAYGRFSQAYERVYGGLQKVYGERPYGGLLDILLVSGCAPLESLP